MLINYGGTSERDHVRKIKHKHGASEQQLSLIFEA